MNFSLIGNIASGKSMRTLINLYNELGTLEFSPTMPCRKTIPTANSASNPLFFLTKVTMNRNLLRCINKRALSFFFGFPLD
jgi:hypothetical protein